MRLMPRPSPMRFAALLAAASVLATARPIRIPEYSELGEKADAILLLEVIAVDAGKPEDTGNPDPTRYRDFVARCRVLATFKGALPDGEIHVPFFRLPDNLPGFNGDIPAPFAVDPNAAYLAYLTRDKAGRWKPAGGSLDAGLSIKTVLRFPRYGKLPGVPADPPR